MPKQPPWRRLLMPSITLLTFAMVVSAQTAEVHLGDDSLLAVNSPAPQGRLPVLFVHGHNDNDNDSDFNYRKNWHDSLRGLPSFKQTLDLMPENDGLGIEPYYIRFVPQNRSITEDAAEISDAVERILHRHDPNYPAQPTNVQIVIIAYSKGTISTRLYLKSLQTQVTGLPAPRPDFHPVSDFIAIASPNHGIGTRLFNLTTSLSVKQLYNGVRASGIIHNCGDSFNEPNATNYIGALNGHAITDTLNAVTPGSHDTEAPGSRADGDPLRAGALYVTLFDELDRDFAGGDVPSGDCVGRAVAVNLASNAQNIPVAGITDTGWDTIPSLGILTDAERKAIAVHQNTVHTPEVICLALYAAVHHRSPVGQTCTMVDGKPVIAPATRAAAMLTLDFSGSMQVVACPSCPTRAAVLKDAVELFVQLWSVVSVPSDRIGVTYFRTNVTSLPSTGDPLPLLSDFSDDVITDVSAQAPNNSTAMGGGLQRAIDALNGVAASTPIRRVILFTDGMQNVNPIVQSVSNQLVIDNQPGRPNSNVSPSVPPTVLDQDVAVDTIGIGAGEDFVGLLQDIADATGGRTWLTTTPDDDLRRFFVEELINALKGFSPQLVAYRHGSIGASGSRETFAIENGVRKLVLKVSWKRGASMNFSVVKDGVDVTSSGRFIDGAFYKIFVIDLPAKGSIRARGNWEVRIKGKATTAYEVGAIVDGSPIIYDAIFATKRPRVGRAVELVFRIKDGKQPVSRTRVNVDLMSPTIAAKDVIATIPTKTLSSFEPGMSIADRRLLGVAQDAKKLAALKPKRQRMVVRERDKGEFRTRFIPQVPGIYTVYVTIEGDNDKIGHFSRTLTAVTVVRQR